MSNNRLGRVNDDIQRVLSDLLRQIKDPRISGKMISVTRVDTTGDLRYAKVYLSVLDEMDERAEKDFNKGLKSASGWLRRELSGALSLRYTPELIFSVDKSIEHGAYIGKILSGLDRRAAGGNNTEEAIADSADNNSAEDGDGNGD